MDSELRAMVERLSNPSDCRHCGEQSAPRYVTTDGMLVAYYVCPKGYVSKIISYGEEVDLPRFKALLTRAAGQVNEVADDDIRLATRYSWDFGVPSKEQRLFRTAYWNQNYRRTKSNDPNRKALFLCKNGDSTFVQPISGTETLCEGCRRS